MKKKKILSTLVTCAMLAMPFSIGASAAIPLDKMIAMYNMEGELKNEVDGKAGTLKNGASFADDATRGGKVLHLNNDDVMTPGQGLGYDAEGQHGVLADSHIPDSEEMTISVWFNSKDVRNWARVIDLGDAAYDNPQRFVNISPFPNNGEYTCGTLNINDGGGRDRVFADTCSDNEWVHAVLVVNGPSSGKPNVLYLNGTPYESTNGNLGDPADPALFSPKDILEASAGIGDSFLGRSRYEANADNIYNGYIDDVAIFSVALTADQVKELSTHDFKAAAAAPAAPEAAPAEAAAPEAPAAQPEAPAAPAPAQAAPAPAPKTADPITLIVLGSIVSAAGVVIAKKRK